MPSIRPQITQAICEPTALVSVYLSLLISYVCFSSWWGYTIAIDRDRMTRLVGGIMKRRQLPSDAPAVETMAEEANGCLTVSIHSRYPQQLTYFKETCSHSQAKAVSLWSNNKARSHYGYVLAMEENDNFISRLFHRSVYIELKDRRGKGLYMQIIGVYDVGLNLLCILQQYI